MRALEQEQLSAVSWLREEIISLKPVRAGSNRQAQPELTIRRSTILVRHLGGQGNCCERFAKLYAPHVRQPAERRTATPLPLVVNLHYELTTEEVELYELLQQEWAVLTASDVPAEHLANIVGDDLLFTMALIDAAAQLPGIDRARIALRGGSAGGYHVWMASTTHFGIVAAFSLWGPVNLSYQMRYLFANQAINAAQEPLLSPKDRSNGYLYPLPGIFGVYGLIADTAHALGSDDMVTQVWKLHSPVLHWERFTHPILSAHSTADLLCPLDPISAKHAYERHDAGMPEQYRVKPRELLSDESLCLPLDEQVPAHLMAINRVVPQQASGNIGSGVIPYPFDATKRISIAVVDEGPLDCNCQHWKHDRCGDGLSEAAFMDYYRRRIAADTNELTPAKLQFLAQRYSGTAPLFSDVNRYKRQCPQIWYGSLTSDRREVLRSLLTYWGIDPEEAAQLDIAQRSGQSIGIAANIAAFADLYDRLDMDNRFLDFVLPEEATRSAASFGDRLVRAAICAYRQSVNAEFADIREEETEENEHQADAGTTR